MKPINRHAAQLFCAVSLGFVFFNLTGCGAEGTMRKGGKLSTTAAVKQHVMGLTPEGVVKLLGRPDMSQVAEFGCDISNDGTYWFYKAALDPDDGTPRDVRVYFRNGVAEGIGFSEKGGGYKDNEIEALDKARAKSGSTKKAAVKRTEN